MFSSEFSESSEQVGVFVFCDGEHTIKRVLFFFFHGFIDNYCVEVWIPGGHTNNCTVVCIIPPVFFPVFRSEITKKKKRPRKQNVGACQARRRNPNEACVFFFYTPFLFMDISRASWERPRRQGVTGG